MAGKGDLHLICVPDEEKKTLMARNEDVHLVCDPEEERKSLKNTEYNPWQENIIFVIFVILMVLLSAFCMSVFQPRPLDLLENIYRLSLGHSERDSAPKSAPKPEKPSIIYGENPKVVYVDSKDIISRETNEVIQDDPRKSNPHQENTNGNAPSRLPLSLRVGEKPKEDPIDEHIEVKVRVDNEIEDSLDYADEVEGLKGHLSGPMPHPDSVAFILPLRDHVGNLGVRFGKQLKEILEASRRDYEVRQHIGNSTANNSLSHGRDLPSILGHTSRVPPSDVLLRDSKGDFEIARQLTLHFYEIHGTTRFFGYLTDEEAMSAALWARVRAPGARFVTPTAISTYLDSAANVIRVQPSSKLLAAALADLLKTADIMRPLVVARASLHTDSFIALLRPLGIKPSQVIHYYETTKFENFVEKIRSRVMAVRQPVLLLGDAESWKIINIADSYFSCLWICPFPSQFHDHIRTTQSELLYFVYRAYDDQAEYYLKNNPILDPNESIIQASLALLNGQKRSWRGTYVVVASVSPKSLKSRTKILGGSDLIPLLQYDVTRKGIVRRIYYELQVNEELLRPLTSSNQCHVVIRYLQELTGKVMTAEVPVNMMLPTLLVPAGRGAQVHLDCPRHHVDLRCSSARDTWSSVNCKGHLKGIHHYQSYCANGVGVTFAATRGCMASKGLVCKNGQTLGCRLSGLCSSVSYSTLMYNCDGIPIVDI
ncbi:hypothetical protein SK128_004064 [Halocaridina rubra]|uniref:Uncharacterized protein n=1 Tax=Halocaridina rubra TaxID=373956 RepID=A0AAN8WIZ5_HALRR